jgi:hypothetical protein
VSSPFTAVLNLITSTPLVNTSKTSWNPKTSIHSIRVLGDIFHDNEH